MHIGYVVISYDANLLGAVARFADPILVERAFMFLQFIPLILVIGLRTFSKSVGFHFIAFAICVSTLCIVSDFNTGFYGSTLISSSNIVPRMRTSAQMLAYRDAGRIVSLDFHADYPLEFLVVHFLSEVTGQNYILAYFVTVRLLSVILWSGLYVMARRTLGDEHRPIWSTLIAISILLANQGYNYETSFAPIMLLLFFLLVNRASFKREHSVSVIFLILGVLASSFRETLLLASISFVAIVIFPLFRKSSGQGHALALSNRSYLVLVTSAILCALRVFVSGSISYFETYEKWFTSLLSSVLVAFNGDFSSRSGVLETVESIRHPLDKGIALGSAISALAILGLIVLLSMLLLCKARFLKTESCLSRLSVGVLITYLFMFLIFISAYAVLKIVGSGPLRDFSSATILARSSAPLAVLTIIPCFAKKEYMRLSARSLMLLLELALFIILILSPFLFLRAETKSAFDMTKVPRDQNEIFVLSTSVYNFTVTRASAEATININQTASYLQNYYYLLFGYRNGEIPSFGISPSKTSTKVFDNGLFTVKISQESVFIEATA